MTLEPTVVDRLTGDRVEVPPRALSGRYYTEHPQLRRLLAYRGDMSGGSALSGRPVTTVVQARHAPSLDTSVAIHRQVEDARTSGFGWVEILELVPPVVVAADVARLLEVSPLERAVARLLPHLEDACDRPATELRFIEERVLVDRARRVSRRATQDLARGSHDWLRATATGVVPRRVTSMVREEIFDIYENRVAARLIDGLSAELGASLKVLDQLANVLTHQLPGWWRKRERMAELWGHAYDDRGDAARLRLDDLRDLVRRVEGLRSTRLYQHVPNRARVAHPLRTTNLLRDDERYQAVQELYDAWWHQSESTMSESDLRKRAVSQDRAFASLCWTMLVRSVVALGRDSLAVGEVDDNVSVRTDWGAIRLVRTSEPDRRIFLEVARSGGVVSRLRIVPLACELASGEVTEVRQMVDLLDTGLGVLAEPESVVVLYPGTSTDADRAPDLADRLHQLPIERPGRPWILGVSPLDLESQDRIDQVVRWHLGPQQALAYPPLVGAPRQMPPVDDRAWLSWRADSRQVAVLSAPPDHEQKRFHDDVLRVARTEEQRLGGLGHEAAKRLRQFADDIGRATSSLEALQTCPVCADTGRLVPRSGDTFEATCACGARYGVRLDARTATRVPYLLVSHSQEPLGLTWRRWLGRDCWSLPCESASPAGRQQVVNPFTGHCTGRGLEAECFRCSSFTLASPTASSVAT